MAKKNKPPKKHRFKHAEPGAGLAPAQEAIQQPSETLSRPAQVVSDNRPAVASATASTVAGRDFSYVAQDLRRIGVFAAILIALELVLWYLMGNTGFGDVIYSLVRV